MADKKTEKLDGVISETRSADHIELKTVQRKYWLDKKCWSLRYSGGSLAVGIISSAIACGVVHLSI